MSDEDSLNEMHVAPQRLMPKSPSLTEHHKILGLHAVHAGNTIATIKAQADILLSMIEVPKLYGAKHNFHFMDQINLKNFTHIFERKVTEYSRATSTDNDASVINWKF